MFSDIRFAFDSIDNHVLRLSSMKNEVTERYVLVFGEFLGLGYGS